MKLNKSLLIALMALPFSIFAQENDSIANSAKPKKKLQRSAFESGMLIENQTDVVNTKGTLEMQLQHRFGSIAGDNNLLGIYGTANIRIGLVYSLTDRISVAFGTTKKGQYQDLGFKGSILRQTRDNSMPVNVTYYGNAAYTGSTATSFAKVNDRWSYFNQLIISRRFNKSLSFQVAPSFTHFNMQQSSTGLNDMFAVAVGGRAKVSDAISIIADYSQPLSKTPNNVTKPGASLGFEYSTGSHAFQLFVTNYSGLVPQQNYMNNTADLQFSKSFMIGFNITRLWHM